MSRPTVCQTHAVSKRATCANGYAVGINTTTTTPFSYLTCIRDTQQWVCPDLSTISSCWSRLHIIFVASDRHRDITGLAGPATLLSVKQHYSTGQRGRVCNHRLRTLHHHQLCSCSDRPGRPDGGAETRSGCWQIKIITSASRPNRRTKQPRSERTLHSGESERERARVQRKQRQLAGGGTNSK